MEDITMSMKLKSLLEIQPPVNNPPAKRKSVRHAIKKPTKDKLIKVIILISCINLFFALMIFLMLVYIFWRVFV